MLSRDVWFSVLSFIRIRSWQLIPFLGWGSFPFLRPGCRNCRKHWEGRRRWCSHGKQVCMGYWAASSKNWRLILLKHTLNVQWAFFLADFPFFFWQTVLLSAVMLQLWSESPRAWELGGRIRAVLTSKAPFPLRALSAPVPTGIYWANSPTCTARGNEGDEEGGVVAGCHVCFASAL